MATDIDKAIVELYAGVGMALTAWARVEWALCGVYCQAISPATVHPKFQSTVSARTFWTVRSLRSRLDITDETCKASYFFSDFPTVWKGLRKRIDDCNSTRNKIAHGRVVRHSSTSATPNYTYLQPYPFSKSDGKTFIGAGENREYPPLGYVDLIQATELFRAFSDDLFLFTEKVFKHFHPNADINTWPIGASFDERQDQ
jgi:hypothetical protein